MVEQIKPEVHLEVCSGFFRIPTETVNYNIRVLDNCESTVNAVVNQIVETETKVKKEPDAPKADDLPAEDKFYQGVFEQFSKDFSLLVEKIPNAEASVVSPIDEIATSAIDSLNGMASSTAEMTQGLMELRDSVASSKEESPESVAEEAEGNTITDGIKEAMAEVAGVKEMLAEIATKRVPSPAPPVPPGEPVTKTRYLFDIDVVFQTLYELCTNETVKTHSQDARAKADDLFDKGIFLDYLSEKVPGYDEDDNFLSVPIDDVLTGLINSCEDNTVNNLFRNMNKKQAEIFLDQFLPLEVPAKEDVVVAGEASSPHEEIDPTVEAGVGELNSDKLAEASELLVKIGNDLEGLLAKDSCSASKDEPAANSMGDTLLPKIDILLEQAKEISPNLKEMAHDFAEIPSSEDGQDQGRLMNEMIHLGQELVRSVNNNGENSGRHLSELGSNDKQRDADVLSGAGSREENAAQSEKVMSESVEKEGTEGQELPLGLDDSDFSNEQQPDDDYDDDDDDDEDFGEASQDDIDKLLENMS